MKPFNLNLLKVNLVEGNWERREVEERTVRSYMGGSGLASKILADHLRPGVDPLGEENLLLLMTGPMTGTVVPSSSRFTAAAKSPLTHLWGEANAGGSWGRELRRTGYDGIWLEGKSRRPVYLWVHDGVVELRDATHLWGGDVFEVHDRVRQETDPKAAVACIGRAGEHRVRMASIVSDGRHARIAARCGLGAVAGAKGLKAVAVRGTGLPFIANPQGLEKSVNALLPSYMENARGMSITGTAWLVVNQEKLGSYPVKNWSLSQWPEGARKTGWEEMQRTIFTRRFHCGGCVIGCGRTVRVKGVEYAGEEQGGPEYETLAMLGSNCLLDQLPALQKAHELCNRYGMDTIEAGAVLAFAMECYERGLISRKDTGGIDLRWGDAKGMLEMITQIGEMTGFGEILGQGLVGASRSIGQGSERYAIHTKGASFAAHDPRGYNSVGLAYATNPRGACHLQGYTNVFERTITMPELGIHEIPDRFSKEGKGELVAPLQDLMAVYDAATICKFSLFGRVKVSHLLEWMNLITGWDMELDELMKVGERIFNMKRMFNVREGVRKKDDTLPERILTEPKTDTPARGNLPPLEKMLKEYYAFRRWDEDGVPKEETLHSLGIEWPVL
jgi:aldehyde:ferredoxin oxidoreductase